MSITITVISGILCLMAGIFLMIGEYRKGRISKLLLVIISIIYLLLIIGILFYLPFSIPQ